LLTFNSGLTSELQKSNTECLFLVRLYYGDESSFTGFSTKDYTDGVDFYHGLISSIGGIQSNINLFSFKTKNSTIAVKLANTKSFKGNRLSDELGTNDYDNRKYEIYIIVPGQSKSIISYGNISSDFNYDMKSITIGLTDFRTSISTVLPRTTIREDDTTNNYHLAPEDNFNKPIPMLFGDHSHNGSYDDGALSEATERWATRSKVPAIIVNEWSTDATAGENGVVAKCDTEAVHTLNDSTVYLYSNDVYSALPSSSVNTSAANGKIVYSGNTAYALVGFNMPYDEDSSFTKDKFEVTNKDTESRSFSNNYVDDIILGPPIIPRLGTITNDNSGAKIKAFITCTASGDVAQTIYLEMDSSTVTNGHSCSPSIGGGAGQRQVIEGGASIGTEYSDNGTSWDFEKEITVQAYALSGSGSMQYDQAWLQIEYDTDDPVGHIGYVEEYKLLNKHDVEQHGEYEEWGTITNSRGYSTPKNIKVVYVSGKGRKFTSAMTSLRSHSFSTSDLIQHPVYVIENILRTELGLTDTNIDTSGFDSIYSNTSTYKTAFSHYQRTSAMELINDICRQFCLYFFFDGEGKATIINLKLASSYSSTSYSIDFDKCSFKGIRKSDIGKVKTQIRVEYDYDYGAEDNRLNIETTSPNNSDFNRDNPLSLTVDCSKIRFDIEQSSLTNAKSLATTIHDLYKDLHSTRKNIILLEALSPEYYKCEIGDLVSLSNTPSDIKLYGTAISSQVFMITKVSKGLTKINLELTQVS